MSTEDVPEEAPRPAATLVLLRDGRTHLEVLLTVRPRTLRFMGGASVFPGGGVHAADRDPRWQEHSKLAPQEAARALDLEDGPMALGFYVAALRETFEEVGLFLGTGTVAQRDADDPEGFLGACKSAGAVLATDQLVPGGRWVTPLGSPIRFDTRFFVTRAPEWDPVIDESEVSAADWVSPAQALTDLASGTRLMAPPTIEMLQRLDAFSSVDEALTQLSERGVGHGDVLSVRLSPLVRVVLAPNPGVMTGPGTNSYVVGGGPHAVIDPAVDDDGYIDALVEASESIELILITHRHPDHVGGVARLQRKTGATVRAFGDEPAGGIVVDHPLEDGEVIEVGGASLRVLYSPGHASDHVCFYLEGAATLFAGDNVLGEGTAVIAPPDGDMRAYLASLRRLRELHIDRIFPGHFKPLDGGSAVIDGYIEHRRARGEAIISALREGPASVEQIVERVYTDVDPSLHPIAAFSVTAYLEMASDDGRVQRQDDMWLLIEGADR